MSAGRIRRYLLSEMSDENFGNVARYHMVGPAHNKFAFIEKNKDFGCVNKCVEAYFIHAVENFCILLSLI